MTDTVPHSREAEEAACGCVLINPESYFEMSRVLRASDFYIHRHVWIWECFTSMVNNRVAIDLITVKDELASRGQLDEIGGPAYLTRLCNLQGSTLNALDYAGIVREHSDRRLGIMKANQMAGAAYDETKTFSLGDFAMDIAKAARGQGKRIDTIDAAKEMIALVSTPRVFTTGIQDVDRKIGGLFPSELSILAGYQGTGKSAEKLQGARRNAEQGKKVVLADLEMTAAQSFFRMACGDLKVDVNQVRSDRVSEEIKEQVINKAGELGEKYQGKIVIYQAPMTPSDILSVAMMEQPDIIYVDTLKNLAGKPAKETARDWYDMALNFLRVNVAQAIGTHVQVLHHINRSTFKENRRPTLHDLMFAGESDADAIFILYREAEDYMVVKDGNIKTVVPIEFLVEKSRFGWTGAESVNFNLVGQSFYGMAPEVQRERKDLE